jgi:outer membrane receptor for ferrienterochelin and colicins
MIMNSVHAQDSLKTVELNELVVTGEVEPQSVQKSVYNVRIIPMERLQSRGATRLQDVLNTELNIRFSQDLALGGSNLSMMGLPGQNVKVLIDGVPVVGRQGTGNEININQININAIERIEIVEGPMAVIYGADALAGVINIITKKSLDDKINISAAIHEESAGDEYGFSKGIHNQNISIGYKHKSFYFSGNLNRNNFRGWQGDSTAREKEWHPKTQWMTGAVMGYRTEKLNAYYRTDYLHEKIYNPAQFQGLEAIDQNYITKRLMHQLQLSANLSEKLNLNTAVGYTNFERRTQSIAVNKETGRATIANSALQNIDQFVGMTIRGSILYKISNSINLQPGYDINTERGRGSRLKDGENSISDYAVFLSAELKLSSFFSIKPGIRVVKNSVYHAPPFIPSINAKVTFSEKHDLRLSYGRGFRAPSIRELYFNFYDASHSIEGNPGLEAELSHSFNASWNARLLETNVWKLTSTLSTFYNYVDNMIDYGVKPGSNATTYININNYKSQGVALNNTVRSIKTELSVGFAYTGRYNALTEADRNLPEFTWSPELNGSLIYHFNKRFQASLFYKYTGNTPSYVIHPTNNTVILSETFGFHWADISVKKSFAKYLSISAGARNVLNVTRVTNAFASSGAAHSGSGTTKPIGYGRSYFIAINFQLTK